jgi:hypothetical protein
MSSVRSAAGNPALARAMIASGVGLGLECAFHEARSCCSSCGRQVADFESLGLRCNNHLKALGYTSPLSGHSAPTEARVRHPRYSAAAWAAVPGVTALLRQLASLEWHPHS